MTKKKDGEAHYVLGMLFKKKNYNLIFGPNLYVFLVLDQKLHNLHFWPKTFRIYGFDPNFFVFHSFGPKFLVFTFLFTSLVKSFILWVW